MLETTTTKEFKLTHQLSDSAFQRLVKRICDQSALELAAPLTRHDLLKREGSHDWVIVRLDLFDKAVADRKPRQPKQEVIEPELVEETALAIANPLDFYSPLAVNQPQQWTHTDRSGLIQQGREALASLSQFSQDNQNAGIQALIEHRKQEGQNLGVLLAQIKLGSALQTENALVDDYLKKQGLGGTQAPS